MKFKLGDTVLVTAGKDKGKKGNITAVFPKEDTVVVEGVNLYTRHIKPMQGRPGDKVSKERPLATAKIAIINEKGERDRIGYKVAKDGSKVRVFKKTGTVVSSPKTEKKK